MAYFRCIGNKDYLEILKGINNPSNNDGVNGQVYLKYADYNSLYDFKEYIEVGSTAGAYIDSGYVLHSTNEYEIKVQYTDTPVNDGYAFGAWRSNGGSYVDFYGGTMRFSVGNEQSITFDTNAHIYKATQSDMLFDGSSVGTPNWNLVDANYTFGIFTDGSRKTSNRINNTKIYYIKIWDNNELVRYFVPVERKSDNEAGMLDIITGIFYDNDGTQSFTVGGTPSLTFDYPITQAYSKINSTWQNLIGTDVRKIMSGQKEPKLYTNGIYYPNSQQITDVSNFTKLYDTTNTVDYGILGTRVENALALTDETTITSYMNGGWDRPQSCFYDNENKIGAYGGYNFGSAKVINSAKFWLGRFSAQNNELTVTIEVLDSNGNWNEITDLDITTDLAYPVNIFEVLIVQEIYGIRWIHKKTPYKTSGNNICFFGMTLYEGIGDSIGVYIPDRTGYIEIPVGYDGIGALVLQ